MAHGEILTRDEVLLHRLTAGATGDDGLLTLAGDLIRQCPECKGYPVVKGYIERGGEMVEVELTCGLCTGHPGLRSLDETRTLARIAAGYLVAMATYDAQDFADAFRADSVSQGAGEDAIRWQRLADERASILAFNARLAEEEAGREACAVAGVDYETWISTEDDTHADELAA